MGWGSNLPNRINFCCWFCGCFSSLHTGGLTALDDVQNQMAVLCMFFLFYYHCLTLFISCSPAACPPGTFKSTQGPGLCLQCPPNSRSTAEAATICVCRNGYYRGDADQPDEPCTSEYISYMTCTLLPTFHACILVGRAHPRSPDPFECERVCDINIEHTGRAFEALCLCRSIYTSV